MSESIHSEPGAEATVTDAIERAIWAAERGELTIHLNDGQQRVVTLQRVRTSHGRIALRTCNADEQQPKPQSVGVRGPIPRISRLVALALRLDEMLHSGAVENIADVARAGNVTTARLRQIINLLDLAPDIQEQLLFLPPTKDGHAAITEPEVRRITTEIDWERQRELFAELLQARRGRNEVPSAVEH